VSGLRPDPAEEFTALPRPLSWIRGGSGRERREENVREVRGGRNRNYMEEPPN